MAWPAAHLALLWPKSATASGPGAKQMALATDLDRPGSMPRCHPKPGGCQARAPTCSIFPEDCSTAPPLGRTDLIVEVPQAKIHTQPVSRRRLPSTSIASLSKTPASALYTEQSLEDWPVEKSQAVLAAIPG